ncbi:sugar transporter, putative [Ricinus communis]|uniref:Sugar transporter, putative n=1 Tax=Ricinus communis TaxID=3988 RepID=B9RYE8_RICCO|nr:sugar transporter, putative [Ricinus communis]
MLLLDQEYGYAVLFCLLKLLIVSLFPLVYSLIFLPFVSESPRWLLVRLRSREALDILKRFARLNGKELPPNLALANPSSPKLGGGAGIKAETKAGENEGLWGTPWAAKQMIRLCQCINGDSCSSYRYYSLGLHKPTYALLAVFIDAGGFHSTSTGCLWSFKSIPFFPCIGLLSVFSGVLSLWLPETGNAPLYETLKQQEEDEKQTCEIR